MMFSRALDMISVVINNHHVDVGYITARLTEHLGIPKKVSEDLLVAALLHDVGAVPMNLHLETLEFESSKVRHDYAGSLFIRTCPFLFDVAELVEYHHLLWSDVKNGGLESRRLGHLICLTDRVDVLFAKHCRDGRDISKSVGLVWEDLKRERGIAYCPEFVDGMGDLLHDGGFLEGLRHSGKALQKTKVMTEFGVTLDLEKVTLFSRLFSLALDARSRFTATHSTGVAAVSAALARCAGWDEEHVRLVYLAGCLHDIGKLGVPNEFIEKPAKLTPEEYIVVREHAANSVRVLDNVPGLDPVGLWGALHHERMDGNGYPLGLTGVQLPVESRLMAVADVFTAITEDRPYRKGMEPDVARGLLLKMADEGALDGELVRLLLDNYASVDEVRRAAQREALDQLVSIQHNMDSKAKIS